MPAWRPVRLRLLVIASLQGIAALVISGRVQPRRAGALITDAVALFHSRPALTRESKSAFAVRIR